MYKFRIIGDIPSRFTKKWYIEQVENLRKQIGPMGLNNNVHIKYKFVTKSNRGNLLSKVQVINRLLKNYGLIMGTDFSTVKHIKATQVGTSKSSQYCDISILSFKQ